MYKVALHCHVSYINKPGAPAADQCTPGFLKLLLSMMSVCIHVCVFTCVCLYVCLPLRLLITSGNMWHVMDPI